MIAIHKVRVIEHRSSNLTCAEALYVQEFNKAPLASLMDVDHVRRTTCPSSN
jgi:hypothetical protein